MQDNANWSKYALSVTKYRTNETRSTSAYNQNLPTKPLVNFDNFVENNDSIDDEDIVLWVNIGMHHDPRAEDVPNTVTTTSMASFILSPFNFFDVRQRIQFFFPSFFF
jgi:primary-amine oxidase